MSQTDVGAPVHLPPAPDIPGNVTPDQLMAPRPMSTDQVAASMPKDDVPIIAEPPAGIVELPAGLIRPDGRLVTTASVRELNGYDEERLSRLSWQDNPAVYFTEMLSLAVERLGDEQPEKDILRQLLIGDRDALILGIRIATYGNEVELQLNCAECDAKSAVTIFLDKDVPVKHLDDPLKRIYDVDLRNGRAEVGLLNGVAQEAFSEHIEKKTQAEINTIMLAKSVLSINGIPTNGKEDDVRKLSSADRQTLVEFIAEHQPGPELGKEITVNCSVCNAEWPVVLGMPTLFRF